MIYWSRRFAFAGSILRFQGGFARTRTVKYLTYMQLTICSLYSSPPPSHSNHLTELFLYDTASRVNSRFQQATRFMQQVRTEHGVCSLWNGLFWGFYRLVRADFKKRGLWSLLPYGKPRWILVRSQHTETVWISTLCSVQLHGCETGVMRPLKQTIAETTASFFTQVRSSCCQHCKDNVFMGLG